MLILIARFEEGKSAVISRHVSGKANQHLVAQRGGSLVKPGVHIVFAYCETRCSTFHFTFPRGGWTSKKKVLLM